MQPDASNQTRLTRNPAADIDPAWSPDGGRIAFTSDRDSNPEIYVVATDGSGVVQHEAHPLRGQVRVDGQVNATRFEHRQQRHHHVERPRQHQRNHLLGADTTRLLQCRPDRVGQLGGH